MTTAITRDAAVPASGTFSAIGTTNAVLATEPGALDGAVDLARTHLAELDRAVSRFRADSEVSRLAELARTADAWCFGSDVFIDHLDAARRAARLSDGLVDFTVGPVVIASGYDLDLDLVRARVTYTPPTRAATVTGWERIVRTGARRVTVPRGAVLDFGATAKAHAADTIAARLGGSLPGGFLVNLGGDIATAGPAPDGGWQVGVEAADGRVRQVVAITDQGVATSSTQLRRWATNAGTAHHIVDPRTGRTAPTVWAMVTCIAVNALEANTASTASIILGEDAPAWLGRHGIAARLERPDGTVVHTPGWPLPTDSERNRR
jgi:thiamine biosynthesis lipoprotein